MTAKNPELRYIAIFVLFWILLLGMATYFFGALSSRQTNPNQELVSRTQNGAVEVQLEANRQGHYLANGTINGHTVTFFLDTGATMVSVPQRIAEEAGLSRGARGRARTAAGTIDIWRSTIDQLSLGAIKLRNVQATINPAMDMDKVLLGMSVLGEVDFSQESGTLTLRQRTR